MQFLRTAFWVVAAVAIALFCKANNRPLDIKVWGDLVWQTRIWFPIVLAFLLGAIPMWIIARAARWQHKRRVDSLERALATATASTATAAPAPADPVLAHPEPVAAPGTQDPAYPQSPPNQTGSA